MKQAQREWLQYAYLGPQFLMCIVIGYYFGNQWFDKWFGTEPVFTYTFSAFGIAAAFLTLYRDVRAMEERLKKEKEAKEAKEAEEYGGSSASDDRSE